MINFSKFEYRIDSIPSDPKEKQKLIEALEGKFIDEIKESDIYREYLKNYDAASVDRFMDEHAKLKASFINNLAYYIKKHNHNDDEAYLNNAREVLEHILQKKLFNLQLQWRAEKITIEEISNSYEFEFWEKHIGFCPFVPPITAHEVNLAKKFLQKYGFSSLDEYSELQSYDQLMEKDESGDLVNMPNWYEFYDEMVGTGILLQLPDIRGGKEEQYIKLAHQAQKEAQEKTTENVAPTTIPLPTLFYFNKDVKNFVDVYEKDPCFKELFRLWFLTIQPTYADPEYNQEKTEWAIRILEEADQPLMVDGNSTWHKALINCAENYISGKIINALDTAYEEYSTCLDLGIAKRFTPEEYKEELEKSYISFFSDLISKGRQLSGEL